MFLSLITSAAITNDLNIVQIFKVYRRPAGSLSAKTINLHRYWPADYVRWSRCRNWLIEWQSIQNKSVNHIDCHYVAIIVIFWCMVVFLFGW